MATYRFGKHKCCDGTIYFSIDRKAWHGWVEEKYWVVSRYNGLVPIMPEAEVKAEMIESAKRLVKAGHTVI